MSYTSPKFNGEPSVEALANGLATLGRYGDEYMVHATDGETLIPPQIFEANPKLKEDLFVQMRKMGVQDPNRFVVGNSLNSINPITGQPEFFFKKIFKAVKKVFKKALPYIAPIVGNMIAPGIGGIIASGLVTKLQGGSWGDVAKNAALSYGLGALGQGLTSGKGFMTGLGEGLMAPIHAGGNLFSGGAKNPLAQGIFGSGKALDLGLGFSGGPTAQQTAFDSETLGDIFPTYQRNPEMAQVRSPAYYNTRPDVKMGIAGMGTPTGQIEPMMTAQGKTPAYYNTRPSVKMGAVPTVSPYDAQGGKPLPFKTGTGAYDPTADPGRLVPKQLLSERQAYDAAVSGGSVADAAGQATEAAGKSLTGYKTLDKMLGEFAVPAALAGLTYLLADDEPELTPDQAKELSDPQRYAYDKYLARGAKKDAEGQALLAQAGIVPSTDPQTLATATGTSLDEANRYLGSIYGSQATMGGATAFGQPLTAPGQAKGGIITLQGGGEIMGPGSGTSDSIPARLSDGEFVMTADAVRGAGNGSRDMGAARMYDLMSRFERAA
jgi:hypothetical protein